MKPDNDPTPAPFGAFAPTAAQAAIIDLAHRSRLKRGAFRPWLSRLVHLLRAGPVDVAYQGASFRFYHQASATERGALFNPDYNIEELDFLRQHVPVIGGVFVDVGANVGTYALALARHVGPAGKVIAIEPHPVTHARLAFNNAASGYTQVKLVAAAAAATDGELMIETDGDNLGASHIVTGDVSSKAIKVPSLRLQRMIEDAGVTRVDALKIDIEGFEDRALIPFFKDAPRTLWPRAVVIEHLSANEWLEDCIADMRARGYVETGKTRSNTLLVLGSPRSIQASCRTEHHRIAFVVPLKPIREHNMTNDNTRDQERAWELMKKIGFAMLVTHDGDKLRARPMSAFLERESNTIYFLTDARRHKDEEIARNPGVNLSFADAGSQKYVSITGTAAVSNDRAKIKQLFSTPAKAWWDSAEDPNIRVLKITPDDAEFWDSPGSVISYVKMAAAAVTGTRPEIGDNRKVSM